MPPHVETHCSAYHFVGSSAAAALPCRPMVVTLVLVSLLDPALPGRLAVD